MNRFTWLVQLKTNLIAGMKSENTVLFSEENTLKVLQTHRLLADLFIPSYLKMQDLLMRRNNAFETTVT